MTRRKENEPGTAVGAFRKAIYAQEQLSMPEKAIALAIAEKADFDSGKNSWVNRETIAKMASCSERTVTRAVNTLEKEGWIEVIRLSETPKDARPDGCPKVRGNAYRVNPNRRQRVTHGHSVAQEGDTESRERGTQSPPTNPSTNPFDQEEEKVEGNAISDSKDKPRPEPPSTGEDSSLDEEQPPTPDEDLTGDGERELFDAWALDRLQKLGAKIGDRNGATIQRAMKLCQAIASFGEGVDYRTRCEWLKNRVDNYTMRQLEDEGPNPPSSVHQAVGWLESDLQGGSLERYYKKVRVERADEERLRNLPPAHECDNHQDIVLPPMFDLEEVAK